MGSAQFIFTNILLIFVGIIMYVVVRTLPRIDENADAEKRGLLERWIASEIPEKIDAALNSFLFKFLRRTKVALLKVDNSLGERLQKIKPDAGISGKMPNIDFKEISGKNKEGAAID